MFPITFILLQTISIKLNDFNFVLMHYIFAAAVDAIEHLFSAYIGLR